ncbi:type VII secretion protein EccCa [Streptantibioticus silvisoli]|uniref:Type VII secretion protein EccCa n=1 Tax=Streptantibioticus silvisoli TaxID=2705255 RepID=A0ABT6W6F0_9ACTN|nr:type VII secretion protein EccCa [Streptantibioticus silvisoli]MDI5965537.1 type VII secretion protein EccCa [Streptantibioticus silvisoli]
MTTRLVHRPARGTRQSADGTPRVVEAPPNLPEGKTGGLTQVLVPITGVMSSMVMMTVMRGGAYAAIGPVVLLVTLATSGGMLLSQRGKAQRTRRQQRERYLEYLEGLREELGGQERKRRAAGQVLNPQPEALYDVVRDPARLWERRRTDADFLRVRVGTGELPLVRLTLARSSGSVLTPPDPFMLNEANALLHRYNQGTGVPVPVPLDRAGEVAVVGPREEAMTVVRALLTQTAALHAPDDVAVAVACPVERLPEWEWVKWLPHALDGRRADGPVAVRRIAPDLPALGALLADDLRERATHAAEIRRGLPGGDASVQGSRLLVISDGHGAVAGRLPLPDEAVGLPEMGVTVVHLLAERTDEPGQVAARVTVSDGEAVVEDLRGPERVVAHARVDAVPEAMAEGLARMLASVRLSADSVADDGPAGPALPFPQLLGIDDPGALDLPRLWAPRGERSFLRVPIGLTDDRRPLLLDLKEAAELGMGPHGLCVGATGSGKSELLRTLVLALALTHRPDDLAMMLVDFKGGATFAPFAGLPHVTGLITNLVDDAGLVERAHASLAGEVLRRQQVLKDAGDVADISQYAAERRERPSLPPLPHLLVVIDEFGELLTAKPEFIELFLSIGRIGRSIGVHLLLSSQRIESGKLKGLDTYLSYRLGLRTFSAEESRTVLDTADAFTNLPPLPGFGYLKVDTSSYERFKAGYVSGPYRGSVAPAARDDGPAVLPYPAFNTLGGPAPDAAGDEPAVPRRTVGATELAVMAAQLRDAAEPVERIWLPPLPSAIALDAVAGTLDVTEDGMRLTDQRPGALRAPLGLLDDPARQWQGTWTADLNRAGGHLAVIGGPQSGKTTLLRSLVLSLALTHTPREVGFYAVDLAGGGLQALAGLPHTGGVAGRSDRERVRRTVEEAHGMLLEREEAFRAHGIDSVTQLRTARATGRLSELPCTDVVLLIDGFGSLRKDFEEVQEMIEALLLRGGGYGIHVVAAMGRWNDVRIADQAAFGTRYELRLNDPGDSCVDRTLATSLRKAPPGRVLTDDKLVAQVALPRVDGRADTDDLGTAVESTAEGVAMAWTGERVRAVRVLPPLLALSALPGAAREPGRVPIGLDQNALAPVLLDLFGRDQHLLVFGDDECGKTNLLRLIARGLTERYTDEQLVFAVMDPRRGLREVAPEPYRGGYAHNSRVAAALATGVAGELAKRLPDDLDPADQQAEPAAFSGPRVVVLVDDYDMLTTAGQQPLTPFLPFVPSAPDIGLHFVVCRRVAGASRGLYDPFLQALRESGTSGLILSGDRTEGQLLSGITASTQPPGRGTLVRRGESPRLVQTALMVGETG